MKYAFLLLLVLSGVTPVLANRLILFEPGQGDCIKLVSLKGRVFLVARKQLAQVEKNRLVNRAAFNFECYDAAVFKENIVLATSDGVKVFDPVSATISAFLQPAVPRESIDHVAVDTKQQLWYAIRLKGCFMVDGAGRINTKVQAPAITALTCTPDGNAWVGTNIGLYKIPPAGNEVFRYTEEGIEGFELPDGIVERLYADDASNIWVVMPENISFIRGTNPGGEIPGYDFIGNKENILFNITRVPASDRAYLFATASGILYAADIKGDAYHHSGEIHRSFNERASLVTDAMLEKPEALKTSPVQQVYFTGSKTYFVTERGLWTVSTRKLLKRLKGM